MNNQHVSRLSSCKKRDLHQSIMLLCAADAPETPLSARLTCAYFAHGNYCKHVHTRPHTARTYNIIIITLLLYATVLLIIRLYRVNAWRFRERSAEIGRISRKSKGAVLHNRCKRVHTRPRAYNVTVLLLLYATILLIIRYIYRVIARRFCDQIGRKSKSAVSKAPSSWLTGLAETAAHGRRSCYITLLSSIPFTFFFFQWPIAIKRSTKSFNLKGLNLLGPKLIPSEWSRLNHNNFHKPLMATRISCTLQFYSMTLR